MRNASTLRAAASWRFLATASTLAALLTLPLACASGPPGRPTQAAGGRSGFVGPKDRDNVVVFIHGVLGSADTWRNAATGAYWPELIQADPDLGDYSIYLVSYASPAMAHASTIAEVATRQLQRLKDEGVLVGRRRVVIVAHSMGGLVAKRMLAEMNRPNRDELDRLDRVKGVVFLSTPAQGATIAEYASWLSFNPQFANMQPADLNAFLQALEDDWQNLLRDRDTLRIPAPRAFCAYETLPTRGIKVVSRVYASTRCDGNPQPMDLDHSGMASPASSSADPYGWVKARMRDAVAARELSRNDMLNEARGPVAGAIPAESLNVPLVLAATDDGMVGKGSMIELHDRIRPRLDRGEKITSLTFNSIPGRPYYVADAIHEYLNVLRNYPVVRYVVFFGEGRYVGWMPMDRFAALFARRGNAVTDWINAGNFAALRQEGMQTESIAGTATALDALKRLEATGSTGLGVLGPDGKLVGIASRDGILTQILSKVLARQ